VVRHVADGNPASCRGLQIDIVHTDAVADDPPTTPHCGNHGSVDRRELRDHKLGILHERDKLFSRPALPGDDFAAKPLEDFLFDIEVIKSVVGDGNFHDSNSVSRRWWRAT